MTKENDVDLFIRHLQTELEETNNILDAQAKEQRQWQIEIAIQEGLNYLKKIENQENRNLLNVFEEIEPVRIIKKKVNGNVSKKKMESNIQCPKCDEQIIGDLGFCESCGHKA